MLVGVLWGGGKGGESERKREGEGEKSGPALWDAGFRAIVALLWGVFGSEAGMGYW